MTISYRSPSLVERIRTLRCAPSNVVAPDSEDLKSRYAFIQIEKADEVVECLTFDNTLDSNLQSESVFTLPNEHEPGNGGLPVQGEPLPVAAESRVQCLGRTSSIGIQTLQHEPKGGDQS